MNGMVLKSARWWELLGVGLLCVALAGCGGSRSTNQEGSASSLLVIPEAVTVQEGATQHFSVMEQNGGGLGVTWSVQEGAAGGTITSAGDYTAPKTAGTYHIAAVSKEDPSQTATATVTVPSVSLNISPAADNLGPRQQRQFSAEVTGTVETLGLTLTWSVAEGAAGGTITSTGLYTAPATAGTYHVEASSADGTDIKGEAAVMVLSSGYFQPTASMEAARAEHTATLLQNGKVLIVGGTDGNTDLRTAELYDPTTDNFALTGDMVQARRDHTATLLENGKVLIAGGKSATADGTEEAVASAELYDPATGTFTSTGDMTAPRSGATATLLADGRVFVAGGYDADIYDPATGGFTQAGNMIPTTQLGRFDHSAVRLADGRVLLAGGEGIFDVLSSAETYDPASALFTATGDMNTFRAFFTLSLLPDGKVLAAGGMDCRYTCKPIQDVDLYDPATGNFMAVDGMHDPHGGHTATVLSNGEVLIVGGKTFTVELYDPASGTFSFRGSMTAERTFHTATLLKDGRVLVTGGQDNAQHPLASAEIYK